MHQSKILGISCFSSLGYVIYDLTGNRIHPVEMIMKTSLVTIPMLFIGALLLQFFYICLSEDYLIWPSIPLCL